MNWQNSDIRKGIKWLMSSIEEDSGQVSSKRLLALSLGAVLIKLIFATIDLVANKTITTIEAVYLDGTVFGFIAVLLGIATYSDLKFNKDNTSKP